jgi:hypothetical protein
MKKVTLISFIFVLFFVYQASADNDEQFSYDKSKVETQLSDLNQLESFVLSHNDVTYSQLKSSGNSLITNVSPNAILPNSAYNSQSKAMEILGICCLGTMAGLLIYLMYIWISYGLS